MSKYEEVTGSRLEARRGGQIALFGFVEDVDKAMSYALKLEETFFELDERVGSKLVARTWLQTYENRDGDRVVIRLTTELKDKWVTIPQSIQISTFTPEVAKKMNQQGVRLFAVFESWRGLGQRSGYFVLVHDQLRLLEGQYPNRAEAMVMEALQSGHVYRSYGEYDSCGARELDTARPYTEEVSRLLSLVGADSVEQLREVHLLWFQESTDEGQSDFDQISSLIATDFILVAIDRNVDKGGWATLKVMVESDFNVRTEVVFYFSHTTPPEVRDRVREVVSRSIAVYMPEFSGGIDLYGEAFGFRMGLSL